jgi:hypothetical protein
MPPARVPVLKIGHLPQPLADKSADIGEFSVATAHFECRISKNRRIWRFC